VVSSAGRDTLANPPTSSRDPGHSTNAAGPSSAGFVDRTHHP